MDPRLFEEKWLYDWETANDMEHWRLGYKAIGMDRWSVVMGWGMGGIQYPPDRTVRPLDRCGALTAFYSAYDLENWLKEYNPDKGVIIIRVGYLIWKPDITRANQLYVPGHVYTGVVPMGTVYARAVYCLE